MFVQRMYNTTVISLVFIASTLYTNNCFSFEISSLNNNYRNAHITIQGTEKTILAIGTVALITTYSMYRIGKWLFHKSDEVITELAQTAIHAASAQYANITTILSTVYTEVEAHQTYITDISESTLYKIATAKYYDARILIYIQRLGNTLQQLQKHAKNLKERIQIAQSKEMQDYESAHLIARMKATIDSIETVLPLLAFAYDYLNYHQSFFVLFETEDSLIYRYERDLQAINTYQGNLSYLRETIHQSVMFYQHNHSDPYHWYLRRLDEDLHSLHIAMNKLTCIYTSRLNVATALCNKLELIRETLIGSPYYADELRALVKIAPTTITAQP